MIARIIRNKIKRFGALMAAGSVIAACLLAPLPALAAPVTPPMTGFAQGPNSTSGLANQKTYQNCKYPYGQLNQNNCDIIKYIVILTNILSGLVGIIIVISITWAGIQYSMSRSDPQAVVAARSRITNSILALVVYIFMIAFLQWAVPGGIF